MSDKDISSSSPTIKPTLPVIHSVVAECFGIGMEELIIFSDRPDRAAPKHVALWLAKQLTDHTDLEITYYFEAHPASLLDAERRITKSYEEDALFRGTINELKSYLNDSEKIQEVLRFLRQKRPSVTVDAIQKAAAEHFGLKQSELVSEKRIRGIARPRQAAMWLAKQLTTRSLPDIGRRFGGRDHTTVLYAVRKIDELRAQDPTLQNALEKLTLKLTGRPFLPRQSGNGTSPDVH